MLYHPLLEDAATARYAGYEQSTPAGDRDCPMRNGEWMISRKKG
jgi:hypothetical protein